MPDACSPSLTDFQTKYDEGQTQLVWQWLSGDLETPVSTYLKLCGDEPYSFLLESVEGGAVLGRYSIIGMDPDVIWRCDGDSAFISRDGKENKDSARVLDSLRALLAESKITDADPELPPMAVSGLFGYMGYDMVRLAEDIPDSNPDDLGVPESIFSRPQLLVIFDNVKNRICLVAPVYKHTENAEGSAEDVYNSACNKLAQAIEKLSGGIDEKYTKAETKLSTPLTVDSNTTREEYHGIVKKAVDYILEGEIFQAVLAQRFETDFDLPPFSLYRALRTLNPSPFMVHMAFEGFTLVASSPEILVRVRDNTVTIRPIAGTRKRGKTEEEDKALAEELLADPKERAEHLMLLDLGRNDVGRVAEFGSMEVTEKFVIEYYSHVMHIVSNVQGKLKDNLDIIDAHFAGFPAGTVSGAPKVRAMEIIDELENSRRSYYGGSMGYFSGNEEMDTCIALRTGLIKDGKLYVQAGGGVVADSDPEFEYQESINKSQAVIRAAEMAIGQAQKTQS